MARATNQRGRGGAWGRVRARGGVLGGTRGGARSGSPDEPMDPADAPTAATNGKPDPDAYQGVTPTSSTGFITLRIPPAKYRELYFRCDSIARAYFYKPLEKHNTFLILKYDSKKGRPEDNRGQEEHFDDSAIDIATPGAELATTQSIVDQQALTAPTRDYLSSLGAVPSQHYNLFARPGPTQSTRGAQTDSARSLDQGAAVNPLDPNSYQGDQSLRDFTLEGTSRQSGVPGPLATASGAAGPSTRKNSKVVRLKLPLGYHLDENMQPVHDPNDVSGILKGVVDDLYDVQSKTHGFIPETQNLLIDKIGDISDKLARLKDVTDPNSSPHNPIHDVRIAPEIVDYVDEGRNPDIFTREFVENVQRGNAVINGKKQGLRDFSVILAQKMKEGLPGVEGQVDRIMQNAGLEKELAEAEERAKEKRKASGGEATNNGET